MAGRIPQYERQLSAQANRRVVNIPVANYDTGEGRAIQQAGEALGEFGRRINDAQRDEQLARADRTVREKLDRLKLDLENDQQTPDDKLEEKFSTEAQKIVDETGKIIGSEPVRKLWNERALGMKADGGVWANKLGRSRQVDKIRAGHVETANALDKQVGDLGVAPETFAASIAGEKAVIARNVERGFYSKEIGADLSARLDALAVKDRFARTRAEVERLVGAGQSEDAKKLIDDFGGDVEQGRALRQAREAAEADVRAAANRAEKAKRDAEIVASNTFEMGLLKGVPGHNYRDLDQLVDKGVISINDAPSLRRSIRAEHDRAEAEAKAAKLSAEQKAFLADRSADYRLVFDAYSMTAPAMFLGGYDTWSDDLRQRYDLMVPDDQRAIDRKLIEMSQEGQTASAAKQVYGALVDEAKRVVPDWRIGSDAKDAPNEGAEFAGKLAKVAEEISQDNGGKPLTVQQVRDAVARALDAYEPGKWSQLPTNLGDAINARIQAGVSPDYDYDAEEMIFDEFRKTNGRAPTQAELEAAYNAVKGGK